jgi:hypothetical protein
MPVESRTNFSSMLGFSFSNGGLVGLHLVGFERGVDPADQHQDQRVDAVTTPLAARCQHLGAAAHLSTLALLQPAVDAEGQQRWNQQQQADQRAAVELLLPDYGLVGFHRQHAEGAADDFRYAEVGDCQREHQAERAEDAVARGRQRHGAEGLPAACAHCRGGVVQARIGQRQRRQQDHQRMREGVERFAQQDAPEAVDAAVHPLLEQALVAEQVDQRDAGQQRRRQQRQQRDRAPHALEWRQRALQPIGEQVGQRHHQQGGRRRHADAARDHREEVGIGDQLAPGRQTGPGAIAVEQRLAEHGHQRQGQRQHQQEQQEILQAVRGGRVAIEGRRRL